MGIAAILFYSAAIAQNTLDWRIRPTNEQFESQQARWNALADFLLDDLRNRSGYPTASWLQGSYKFGTQIRPASIGQEFDIDLGVYFRWMGEADEGAHGPADLKDFVQEAVEAYARDPGNDAQKVSPPKARCSRIHFNDSFHIDVPTYHLDSNRDARMLATDEDQWEDSDPKAIYTWWKDQFEGSERERARRLVRYLKMWAALTFKVDDRPSSILLTVLAANAIAAADTDPAGDDEWLQAIVDQIIRRLRRSPTVRNPVNSSEDLNRLSGDATDVFVDELLDLLAIADRALAAGSQADAANIWSEAFQHFFPMPETEEVMKSESRALARVLFDPDVAVTARAAGSSAVIRGRNRIGPIPKDCSIDFQLMNADDLPTHAEVSWMVRNEGEQAETSNDLGHRAGSGYSATEHSAYAGRHFMDVTVKQYGRLVGFRRVPVAISGYNMPRRNPPRPAFVKLRGRR